MFKDRVLEIVKSIPKGKTLSYKQVAKLAGNEKAARVVGSVLRRNKDLSIPCHRVIKSTGEIGEYNGLRGKSKKVLLEQEKSPI